MNASIATIEAAEKMVARNTALQAALRDWHRHKGQLNAADRDKPFDKWLRDLLFYLSDQVKEVDPAPDKLVAALKINAIGEDLALLWAYEMSQNGLQTDINCYVEEGVVFSNLWLCDSEKVAVKMYAEEVAGKFREAGYSAEVWVDEEDEREVTVNAQIDFSAYLKTKP